MRLIDIDPQKIWMDLPQNKTHLKHLEVSEGRPGLDL